MYVKVFRTIFDGSLYGKFEPTVVFLAMLVLAERNGNVDMTAEAIAARVGYPLAIVKRGLEELEKPDPASRSPEEEGRRIIRLDEHRAWGWKITNYEKYDKIRTAAERQEYFKLKKREQRAKSKLSTNVHTATVDKLDSPPCPPLQHQHHLQQNPKRADTPVDKSAPAQQTEESGFANELAADKSNGQRQPVNDPLTPERRADLVYRMLIDTGGTSPPRDARLQHAIDAAGGWSRISQRTEYEAGKIQRDFCHAYAKYAS